MISLVSMFASELVPNEIDVVGIPERHLRPDLADKDLEYQCLVDLQLANQSYSHEPSNDGNRKQAAWRRQNGLVHICQVKLCMVRKRYDGRN